MFVTELIRPWIFSFYKSLFVNAKGQSVQKLIQSNFIFQPGHQMESNINIQTTSNATHENNKVE